MAQQGLFKRCTNCGQKISQTDGHSFCLLCLGETHVVESCSYCQKFSKQARKNRAGRLRALLWQKALEAVDKPKAMDSLPQLPPTRSDPFKVPPSSSSLSASSKTAKKIAKRARECSGTERIPKKKSKLKAGKRDTAKPVPSVPTSPVPSTSVPRHAAVAKSPISSLQTPRRSLPPNTSPIPELPQLRPFSIPKRTTQSASPSSNPSPLAERAPQPSVPMPLNIVTIDEGIQASISEGEIRSTSRDVEPIPASQEEPIPIGFESRRDRRAPPQMTIGTEDERRYREMLDTEDNRRYRGDLDTEDNRRYRGDFDTEEYRYRREPSHYYYSPRSMQDAPYWERSRSPPRMRDFYNQPRYPSHHDRWDHGGYEDFYNPYPRFRQPPSATVSRPPAEQTQSHPRQTLQPASVPTTSAPAQIRQPLPISEGRVAAMEVPSDDDYRSDSSGEQSPAPSIPSPDDLVISSDVVSPSEDLTHFADQVQRMARSLGIEMSQPVEKLNDPVYDDAYCESSTPAAIPYLPVLLRTAQQSWKLPSSMPPTSKRLENTYKIQEKSAPFLYMHPKPNSIIVEASQGHSNRKHNAPVDKEGRRLDGLGRRIYSSTALSLRVHNYQATMAKYQQFLWDKMATLTSHLPEEQRELADIFYKEAMSLSRQQLTTARHATDCASKAMIGSIALRRHAWLRSAGLTQEARSRIEDLPFDGEGLFHCSTDESMESIQKARNTAKRMGIGQQQQAQRQFRQRRWPRVQQQQQQQFQPRQQFQDRIPRYPPQGQFRGQQFTSRPKQAKTKPDFNQRRRL